MRAIESIVSWGTPEAMPLREDLRAGLGLLPVDRGAGGLDDPASRRSTTSGPMPSPGIRVTGMRVSVALTGASFAAAGRTRSS